MICLSLKLCQLYLWFFGYSGVIASQVYLLIPVTLKLISHYVKRGEIYSLLVRK